MDFILQTFPDKFTYEDIVDFNGAQSAFIGGFLSQFMKGGSLINCCNVGKDALGFILRNEGFNFPKNYY